MQTPTRIHRRSILLALMCVALCVASQRCIPALQSPEVAESYPTETTGFTNQRPQIFLKFSKEMNQEITQNAFSLTGDAPVPKGSFRWSGNTMYYVLETDLEYAGRYTVKLLPSAEAADKSKYNTTFLAHFYAGDDLQVTQITATNPANLTMNVPLTQPIDITFSRAMSPSQTEAAFQLSPAIAGLFTWSAGNTVLTYTPFQGLTFNQQYTVTISKTAKDARGMPLLADYVFYFKAGTNFVKPQVLTVNTTSTPVYDYLTVLTPPTTVEKNEGFVVTFDKPMDYTLTQSAFSITDAQFGNTVAGSFTWLGGFLSFTFQPTDLLVPGREYYLRITPAAKDTLGNTLLIQADNSFTVNGASSQYLRVTGVQLDPSCIATHIDTVGNRTFNVLTPPLDYKPEVFFSIAPAWTCQIIISFSAPVVVNTVQNNISITRKVGEDSTLFGVISSVFWTSSTSLTLGLAQLGRNDYELKIIGATSGARDQNNNYMQSDFSLIFRTRQP